MIKLEDDIEELLQRSANSNGIPFDLAMSILSAEMSKAHMVRRTGIYNEIRHLIRQYVANNLKKLSSEEEGGNTVAD